MAVPVNTVQTFQMVGVREELSDVITNIMPDETPFFSMCKKVKIGSRSPEWQRDVDADPDPTNAVLEGDDVANDAGNQPQRIKNYVQLFDKVAQVSTTANAVNTAGRSNEMKFQMAKRGREMKRDIETRACGNFASIVGNGGAAGQFGGAEAFISSNINRGAAGANGGFNPGTGLISAATDGTIRVATEKMFKDLISDTWIHGGEPATLLVGPKMKQHVSQTFTGIAAQQNDVNGQNKIIIYGAADVYKSDFGTHKIIPTRLGSYGTGRVRLYRPTTPAEHEVANRSVLVLTPSTWSIAFLQPMKQEPLAKLGHSERRMISCELTLECSEERANAILADVKAA